MASGAPAPQPQPPTPADARRDPILRFLLWAAVVSGGAATAFFVLEIGRRHQGSLDDSLEVLVPLGLAISAEVLVIACLLGFFEHGAQKRRAQQEEAAAAEAEATVRQVWDQALVREFDPVGDDAAMHAYRAVGGLLFAARDFAALDPGSQEWGEVQAGYDSWRFVASLRRESVDTLVAAAQEIRVAVSREPGAAQAAQYDRMRDVQDATWLESEVIERQARRLAEAVRAQLLAVPGASSELVDAHTRLSIAVASLGEALARARLVERRGQESSAGRLREQQLALSAAHLDMDRVSAARQATVVLAASVAEVMAALLEVRDRASGESTARPDDGQGPHRDLLEVGFRQVSFNSLSLDHLLPQSS